MTNDSYAFVARFANILGVAFISAITSSAFFCAADDTFNGIAWISCFVVSTFLLITFWAATGILLISVTTSSVFEITAFLVLSGIFCIVVTVSWILFCAAVTIDFFKLTNGTPNRPINSTLTLFANVSFTFLRAKFPSSSVAIVNR